MKKFESLGKRLSKQEQKSIKGGLDPNNCPEGETNYHCCIEWVDNRPTSNEDFCAVSIFYANTGVAQLHAGLTSSTSCSA